MNNIRHGALIKSAPPIVLKQSSAHFDMVSDFTGDGSQNKEAFSEFAGAMFFQASAKKRFVATAGLEIKSHMVGIPQVRSQVSGPTIGETGQVNDPLNSQNLYGDNGESLTETPIECAYVFPFNRWNMRGHGTLVASTEIASYPATNTYLQQRSKVWRSTSTTASLTRDLANPYLISAVCIVSHNLTSTGTFRVRVGNDATFTTNKYDSGTLRIWEPSFALSGLYGEEAVDTDGPISEGDSGLGYPSNELIELLRYCGENPRVVRWVTFGEINARHIKIDFEDTENSHSLIEVAYVYIGLHYKQKPDQVYGWTMHPISVSRIKKSASGSVWIDMMYRQPKFSATFAANPQPQTIAFWNLLAGMLGKNKEFIVAFQPDNLPRKMWFTSYCRFEEAPQLTGAALNTYSTELLLEELTG